MADVGMIVGLVGGIIGVLSGGGVIGLWRTLRLESREEHHTFFATYEKSIATLKSQL